MRKEETANTNVGIRDEPNVSSNVVHFTLIFFQTDFHQHELKQHLQQHKLKPHSHHLQCWTCYQSNIINLLLTVNNSCQMTNDDSMPSNQISVTVFELTHGS